MTKLMTKLPNGLEALLGVHSVQAIREIEEVYGRHVLLLKIDEEVLAVFSATGSQLQVSYMRDGQWPFLTDRLSRLWGKELEASSQREPPAVCNFIHGARLNTPKGLFTNTVFAVDEASGLLVLEIGLNPGSFSRNSVMLSMCSDFIIPQDTAQTISLRRQVAFHPSRFVIGGNPDN
jgi:hypothetical protein